jgi:DNA-binding LytR/AlgR family response regulator
VLPSELGDDLIAVTSELQYLRVWTSRGCALVLGSLQQVEDEEGAAGIRLHRSWWVHARHVRSVRRRGEGAVCELSNGREVPVSRRRKTDVLVRFGDGTRYGP